MLHVVDLDATLSTGRNNTEIIQDLAQSVSIPVQAAGGLRTEQAVSDMLEHTKRAVIGTLAFDKRALQSLSKKHGIRLVVSVDHDNGMVATHGWRRSSGIELIPAIKRFRSSGATEFLVTSISRDGTLAGPDMGNLISACGISGSNIIASGGISGASDVRTVLEHAPYGVILGKALYEGKVTIGEALNEKKRREKELRENTPPETMATVKSALSEMTSNITEELRQTTPSKIITIIQRALSKILNIIKGRSRATISTIIEALLAMIIVIATDTLNKKALHEKITVVENALTTV